MSNDAVSHVWSRSRQGGSKLLMLVKIADGCDDDGRNCFAEVPYLARRCRMTPRGAQKMLQRLVDLREVDIEWNDSDRPVMLRGGRLFRPKWFLHVRCCFAWEFYKDEDPQECEQSSHSEAALRRGRPRRKCEQRSHSDGPLMRKKFAINANTAAPKCEQSDPAYKEGSVSDDLLVRSVQGTQKQAPAAPPSIPPVDPNDNLAVLTKLAHEVLDLFAQTPNVELGEITEAVKSHAATLHIAYNSDVVRKAIDSAIYQRRQAGKPSVIPWLDARLPKPSDEDGD